ncbi:MAG: ketoacyl-ACP synthase III [Bacteroidota bacterium]
MMSGRRGVISGIGMYAPEKEIPNSYFETLLGESVDEWLKENLNIHNRRWCAPDESTADLCEEATKETLKSAGLNATDLDLIIVSTDTPEFISPSTASVLQDRIGAKNAGTFDINTACAGFVTALDVAAKYLSADEQYKHILVVGAYAMSKYLNMKDKKTVTLFADGAGAVILSADNNTDRGFLTSELTTEGQYNGWMGIYGGATNRPISEEVLKNNDHQLKFVHKFPKEINPETWTKMTHSMCRKLGIEPDEVDQYILTQLNINSIYETMDNLKVSRNKSHTIMKDYGYTGSACIPMALCDAVQTGKVKENDLLFLIGSGGGLAFASAAIKF